MSSFPLPLLPRKDEAGQLKKHAAKRDWFTLFTWYNDKQQHICLSFSYKKWFGYEQKNLF